MKITSVEALPFRIPLKKVTEWARGTLDAAEHVLVRVYTDEGITGVAEAPPRPTIYGESMASVKFAVENWLGPMVIGMDPFETGRIWDKFDMIAANNTAKGAIDIALYDIMGKAVNLPCYKLLGCWTNKIQMSWCVNCCSHTIV
jgi:L-alanine-DL-glutamate epimerase-like enolase superfamily enzyme